MEKVRCSACENRGGRSTIPNLNGRLIGLTAKSQKDTGQADELWGRELQKKKKEHSQAQGGQINHGKDNVSTKKLINVKHEKRKKEGQTKKGSDTRRYSSGPASYAKGRKRPRETKWIKGGEPWAPG